jgi:RNA-directed DNA polymerase
VPERVTVSSRSEKSAEAAVVGGQAAKPSHRRRAEREGVFEAMSMWRASHQMPAQAGRSGVGRGESACGSGSDEARRPRHGSESTGSALLLAALARENLQRAWKRVRANKGVAGVDGLDIDQTAAHLRTAWPVIREQLLSGTYRPGPVRRVTIPKPEGVV